MQRMVFSCLATLILLGMPSPRPAHGQPAAPGPGQDALRRFALVAGANDGGPGRVKLRYAASDAQAMARVLEELGGVAAADRLLLVEPDRAALLAGVRQLEGRIVAARPAPPARVEVLLYYSGHSDEEGLLLQGERITYRELRTALEGLPADVRLAILDSCASGQLTRRKGGVHRPPFLVDASAQVSGHAFLTSSSAEEAAQESDRVGGSFFTHYLISGLRGAADVTRDGRVTLNEAYQFAFHETLARTEQTQGGPQHPAYDIQLAGTGDVVLTDLRGTSAGLVLAEPLQGRLFVRNDAGQFVAELAKPAGRAVELGLQPGLYHLTLEQQGRVLLAEITLAEGYRPELTELQFREVAGEATALRGGTPTIAAADAGPRTFPFAFSLLPGMGTAGMDDPPRIRGAALNLIAGHYAGLDGFEASGAVGWEDGDVRGFQAAGAVNVAGGVQRGVQVAGAVNYAGGDAGTLRAAGAANVARGDVRGLEAAGGFDVVLGRLGGAQFAGALSWAGEGARGIQAAGGASYSGGEMRGVQVAGATSVARGDLRGLQLAGGVNFAGGNVSGAQLSVINIGADVKGAQIGVINVGRNVHGAQIGVINVAKDVHGLPFGLLNIVEEGMLHGEFWGDEMGLGHMGLKLGSRHFYTLLGAAARPGSDPLRWAYEFGLGGHFGADPLYFELDASGLTLWDDTDHLIDHGTLGRLRLTCGWQILPRLAVFGGVSANVLVTADPLRVRSETTYAHTWELRTADPRVTMWPGAFLGVRI